MLPDTHTGYLNIRYTPRRTPTPLGPGAPRAALLQTPHLSQDLASSGIGFLLHSLRSPSLARRRARRAPRPPRRSAMARARSQARGVRTPDRSRAAGATRIPLIYRETPPPARPPEQTAPGPQCGRGVRTDPDAAQAPGQGVRSAGVVPTRATPHPCFPPPPPRPAAALGPVCATSLGLRKRQGPTGSRCWKPSSWACTK